MRKFYQIILFIFVSFFSLAQEAKIDSLSIELGTGFLYSNLDVIPHYLAFNRNGEIKGDGIFGQFRANYQKELTSGLELKAGIHFRNSTVSELQVGVEFNDWSISLGRVPKVFGGHSPELVSGSLALGNNALPVPGIYVELLDFKPVPLTGAYFKFKGHFYHGFLDDNRVIENARLHSKSFYLMLDLRKEIGLDISSGVVHFAMYGGVDENNNQMEASFSDYLKVFFGQGIPNPITNEIGEANALGNHLGIVETTINQRIGNYNFRVNYQGPFEDEGGLQYLSGTDGLLSLEIERNKKGRLIDKIYLEYLQTKWQSGPGVPDPLGNVTNRELNQGYDFGGRDDYYNNWLYRSGWSYNEQILSNPLFLTHARLEEVFGRFPEYQVAISNNRISAFHIGFSGHLSDKVSYRSLLTISYNFGTYAGLYQGKFEWNGQQTNPNFDYVFLPRRRQYNSLLELNIQDTFEVPGLRTKVLIALDRGEIYKNFGAEVGFFYNLSSLFN